MKRCAIPIACAALLAAGCLLAWPYLSPTMSWGRFVGIAEAALKREAHPVIALGKRVLAPDGDEDRPLRCDPGQSITIVGTGRADGDFARVLLGAGDIRFEHVRVIDARGDGGIFAQLDGASSLSIRLDARCAVQVGSDFTQTALFVRLSEFDDGARLFIENAGELRGRNGVMVSVNDHHAYQAEIQNSGLIEAEQSGIVFDDAAAGSDSRVRIANTGTIASGERTAVYANVYARDGDAAFELHNEGVIRSADFRGVSANVGSGGGTASMAVGNEKQGAIESAEACVVAGLSGQSRIRVEGEGALRSHVDRPPVRVGFNWLIAPSRMPAGWDADAPASLAAAKAHAEDMLAATGAAALPVGTEISTWVRVSQRQDWIDDGILYRAGFRLRVEEGGTLSPLVPN